MRASGSCAPCCPISRPQRTRTPSSRPIAPKGGRRRRLTPDSSIVSGARCWPSRPDIRLKAE
eukprot:11802046-Alexandrium_andersonii.AAC.1